MDDLMEKIRENDRELDKLMEEFNESCEWLKGVIAKLPDKKNED